MAEDKAKVENKLQGVSTIQHLDRDPNDPRRSIPAQPNLSNLTEEDPEVEPTFQNPVE